MNLETNLETSYETYDYKKKFGKYVNEVEKLNYKFSFPLLLILAEIIA